MHRTRKEKSLAKSIVMNGVTIRELEEGEPCRYLGQDETIGYDGKLNQDRVRSEYFRRVKKFGHQNSMREIRFLRTIHLHYQCLCRPSEY